MTLYDKIAYFHRMTEAELAGLDSIRQIRPIRPAIEISYPLARILSQLQYAMSLSEAAEHRYDAVIEAAADELMRLYSRDGVITRESCAIGEKMLMPLHEAAKSYQVHAVAHAHIDMNWMWGYPETAQTVTDTVRTMLDLMEEYPDFTFGQSQAAVYEILEKYAPDMLEEVKMRIREGRWEVTASTWVEADRNMPGGEACMRQFLYGKRYLSRLLDISPESLTLDYEPDTFGHAASVPELCAAAGMKYYYYNRGDTSPEFAHVWRWKSGAEVLAWRDPLSYGSIVDYNILAPVPQHCMKYGSRQYLMVYGVSDHGGGPTRRDLDRLHDMASWPIMPTIIMSTYGRFFRELEQCRTTLPVVEGELNYIYTGCYTSQARLKTANRMGEDRLNEAETLGVMAKVFTGMRGQQDMYERAWRHILFSQFHDILPGSCVLQSREYAMGSFQEAMAAASVGASEAMRALARSIDTAVLASGEDVKDFAAGAGSGVLAAPESGYVFSCGERGSGIRRVFHVFNPTAFDRDEVVKMPVWDWLGDPAQAEMRDAQGALVELQLLEGDKFVWRHVCKVFAFRAKVPAYGYATFVLDQAQQRSGSYVHNWSTRRDSYPQGDWILENSRIRAVFARRTAKLISVTDKCTGQELVGGTGCGFTLIHENVRAGMTAWRIGEYMTVEDLQETCDVDIYDVCTEGLCKRICFRIRFGSGSCVTAVVRLDGDSDTLVYETETELREQGSEDTFVPQVSFRMSVGYPMEARRYDIPFGSLERPAWDHDVPALSYGAAVAVQGPSLALFTDGQYGFRGSEREISLAMVRASYEPDPEPERAPVRMRIGVGMMRNCTQQALLKRSNLFAHPMAVCSARPGKGTLPMTGSFMQVNGNAAVSAVKVAQEGQDIIVRVYDACGAGGDFKLTFAQQIDSAWETDAVELRNVPVRFNANSIEGVLLSGGVKTIGIRLKKS